MEYSVAGHNRIYKSTLIQPSTLPVGLVVFLFALNIFLSITALLGNILILIALHKVPSLHPPTKLLFRCLAVTDLGVGFVTQPFIAIIILSDITDINSSFLHYVAKVNTTSAFVFCGVSIGASTAISVDRLLALLLGVRYRHVITLGRVRAIVICVWLFAILAAFLLLFWNYHLLLIIGSVLVTLCVVISILSYAMIFLRLRRHQHQVKDHLQQGQPNEQANALNIAKYKKTVSSIAWVQLALISCYVPFGITVALVKTGQIVGFNGISLTLLYLNSSLNPIVFCWKIGDVRQAVKDTIREFCCFSF